jgi:hypothetical protein
MSNNLTNSFVRGFGWGLGRSAANSLTSSRKQSTSQPSFSKKQLGLIQEYEDIKKGILGVLKETELYYTNGKITEGEYNILKSKCNDQLLEADTEITKVKSISESKGGSPWIFITLVILAIWAIIKLHH